MAAEAKSKPRPNAAISKTDSSPTKPKSSGVLDYTAWALDHALSLRDKRAIAIASPLAVGCMDAGIAEIALHAIKQKLCPFEFQISFRAEQDRAKLSCLKHHFPDKHIHNFHDSTDLQHAQPKDNDGRIAQRPVVGLLLCGIDCKVMKQLNHETTSDAGMPSSSLKGLLSYLEACSFPERPQMIILSCTQRFRRASMEPDAVDSNTCMQDIALALGKQGYVGVWRSVCPSMFFLPLQRPRMYGLFLKLHKAGPEGLAQRRRDLQAALSLLGRLKLPFPEELETVLARIHGRPTTSSGAPRNVQRKRCSSGASSSVGGSETALGQSDDASAKRARGVDGRRHHHNMCPEMDFKWVMGANLNERQLNLTWEKVQRVTKSKGWRNSLIVVAVANTGVSVKVGAFPCTPGENARHWLLDHGDLQEANDTTLLASQGRQCREVELFKLDPMNGNLMRSLTNSAFTANVTVAFILAGLSVALEAS
jgi:hypothetical protein